MCYFIDLTQRIQTNLLIFSRKNLRILNTKNIQISKGDILRCSLWILNFKLTFLGVVISITNKAVGNLKSTITLSNVIDRVGVSLICSVYPYRVHLNVKSEDYKRKFLTYKSAKLYYLYNKKNQATKI